MKHANKFAFMHCLIIAGFAAALSYFILSKILGQSSVLTTWDMEYIPLVLSSIIGINVLMFVRKLKSVDPQTTGSKSDTSATTDTE
ncbi:hypothetical protein ACX15B_27730 (plasmid) [Vibrio harveyi]